MRKSDYGVMHMDIFELILKYLQVFLSWPVIVGLLAFYFMKYYHEPINNLLGRITEGQFLGGGFRAAPFSTTAQETVQTKQDEIRAIKTEEMAVSVERERLVEKLLSMSRLAEKDAQVYREKFKEKEQELLDIKIKQAKLENELADASVHQLISGMTLSRIDMFRLIIQSIGLSNFESEDCNAVQESFNKLRFEPMIEKWLYEIELIDKDKKLLPKGYRVLQAIYDKYRGA